MGDEGGWSSGEVVLVVEDDGWAGLKSQRPRRRKQAGQVAKPGTWPSSSACQPVRARRRAGVLMVGFSVGSGGEGFGCAGGVVGCCEGSFVVGGGVLGLDVGCRMGRARADSSAVSRSEGMEMWEGSEAAMAVREM